MSVMFAPKQLADDDGLQIEEEEKQQIRDNGHQINSINKEHISSDEKFQRNTLSVIAAFATSNGHLAGSCGQVFAEPALQHCDTSTRLMV